MTRHLQDKKIRPDIYGSVSLKVTCIIYIQNFTWIIWHRFEPASPLKWKINRHLFLQIFSVHHLDAEELIQVQIKKLLLTCTCYVILILSSWFAFNCLLAIQIFKRFIDKPYEVLYLFSSIKFLHQVTTELVLTFMYGHQNQQKTSNVTSKLCSMIKYDF